MSTPLEELVRTLLWSGYARYPYTPGATNATPTPFGIAYPPAYARTVSGSFDHVQLEVVAAADGGARLACTARFLQSVGRDHLAVERCVASPSRTLAELAGRPAETDLAPATPDGFRGGVRVATDALGGRLWRVRVRVENRTPLDEADARVTTRPQALALALLSIHVVAVLEGGRFVSPRETDGREGAAARACTSANVWPVLVAPGDDVVLGSATVLPEHPELAPQSLGSLFDGTEVEEALVLHARTPSQEERAAIDAEDPRARSGGGEFRRGARGSLDA